MGLISEIQGIKSETFILGLLDLLFLILPGVMVIFLYKPELFQSLDWIKLTLLSASITLPFTLVNTFSIAILSAKKTQTNDTLFLDFSIGTIVTGIVVYIALGCLFTFGKSLKSIFIFVSVLELLLVIWILLKKK